MTNVLKLFTVFDIKAEYYNEPFYARTTGEAIRSLLTHISQSSQSLLAQSPSDFVLYELGSYDKDTGIIQPCERQRIGCIADFVTQPETQSN